MTKRPYLLIFALSAAFFAWVHVVPGFGDPDAYYHLEATRRTLASGPVTEFPWLPLTTLAERFADHHFLYHLALAPFIALFGDFLGLKVATVLFAALAMTAFPYLLAAYGLRRPFLWTLPLLLAPGFVFRLLLTKATALALAALFLFLVALRHRRRAAVFAIAFAYVWLHGGWPLLVVAAALDAIVRRSGRMLAPTALGLAGGLVLNPFFPDNLSFYWEQIVQIAVIGRQDPLVLVGGEWYPVEIGTLFLQNAALLAPIAAGVGALAYAVWTRQAVPDGVRLSPERRRDVAFAYAFAAVLLLMTLRQARHKEYFLPMLLLAGATIAETAFLAVDPRRLLARARAALGRLAVPIGAALLLAAGAYAAACLYVPRRDFGDTRPWSRFEAAGAWMRAHVPARETVFHEWWDDFPQLWYRAPDQRYIAGLDAMFLHRKDPETYWLWRDIAEGRRREGLADLIRSEFGARHVLIRMGPSPLLSLMKNDPSFERVYADSDAQIWAIR